MIFSENAAGYKHTSQKLGQKALVFPQPTYKPAHLKPSGADLKGD
jgi:hypothetical protein